MRGLVHYGRAATPWALVSTTAFVVVALLAVVARWPTAVWPLHGGAIGLLAGVSAWAADERCAAVVDVAVRPLWWRTAGRAPAALLLVAVWIATHVVVRDRLPAHLGVLLLQGVAAAAAGFAAATHVRAHGRAEPGERIAFVVAPATLAVALAKPWSEHVPLFPIWPDEDWARATGIWASVAALAILSMVLAIGRERRSIGAVRGHPTL